MTAVVCVFCCLQGFSPIDALGPKQVSFTSDSHIFCLHVQSQNAHAEKM